MGGDEAVCAPKMMKCGNKFLLRLRQRSDGMSGGMKSFLSKSILGPSLTKEKDTEEKLRAGENGYFFLASFFLGVGMKFRN